MIRIKHTLSLLELQTFAQALIKTTFAGQTQEPIVMCCGLLKNSKTIITKKGDKMAFVTLEDNDSSAEIVVFPKLFAVVEEWLTTYNVFIVKGNLDLPQDKNAKLKHHFLCQLNSFLSTFTKLSQ